MTRPFTPLSDREHNARGLALRVLLESYHSAAFVREILDHYLGQVSLSPADRRLATQLAYGVLRRRGTLDYLLRLVSSRPRHRVNPSIWEIQRLGAFQLALLTHVPPYAAINESVKQVTAWVFPQAKDRAKGFVNGVLRSLAKLLTDDRITAPAPDALPLEGGQYRRLARPVLPDPAASRVEYFAAAFSLPKWLAERWAGRFAWDECLRVGFWFAGPAHVWLRCNPLRVDRDTFLAALTQTGVTAEPGEHPQAVRLLDSAAIRDLPGYNEGWFAVQDQSAMRVASALAPTAGAAVLDLCAAPGGKTTHLAELMQNQGQIVACDVNEGRLATLTELCRRLGVGIVETVRLHAERNEEPPAGPFDAALVDVPCSNTGVLGRRPEARWRLRPGDFHDLVQLQTKLLLQAGERVRPSGAIVYSTCSIEPEENGQVVRAALRGLPGWTLEAEEDQVPGRPADGGYWARLWRGD